MSPNDAVKTASKQEGLSITQLAKITGFSRQHLSGVISGRIHSPRAKKIIALALECEYETLWLTQDS
jgi:transcriptional regulator with XRE-family HTH domain